MKRKLASLQLVLDVKEHPNADNLELLKIQGWQVVASKEQKFKIGDVVIYFEIDSFLPIKPEYEFLRNSSFKKDQILGDGFLIKTKKIRGELSQGLVMPISILGLTQKQILKRENKNSETIQYWINKDLTEELGVRKWEFINSLTTGGTTIGKADKYINITDEIRVQNVPDIINELKNVPYYITTKLDGSSHSICIDKTGFHVFGRNYEYADDGKSSFYEFIKRNNILNTLKEYYDKNKLDKLVVSGEFCGPGIQKNNLKLTNPNWFVFTLEENNKRCSLVKMNALDDFFKEQKTKLDFVPLQEVGSQFTDKYPNIDVLLERASKDTSNIYCGGEPEGIVIRSITPIKSKILNGDYLSFKVINNKYLLK